MAETDILFEDNPGSLDAQFAALCHIEDMARVTLADIDDNWD